MRLGLPFALLVASVSSVAAQRPIIPGLSRGPIESATFDTSKAPFSVLGATIEQMSFQRLRGDAPGDWATSITMAALATSHGGDGGRLGVLLGTYSSVNRTFVANKKAAMLNSRVDHTCCLQIEPTLGRYAVIDRFTVANVSHVGVFFSSRATANDAFGAAVKVENIKLMTLGFGDPALGYVDGKLKLFYAGSKGIYMDDLVLTPLSRPRVTGLPVLVAKSSRTPAGEVAGASLLTGPDGDVEGMFLSDLVLNTSDSDMFFANDLDPDTPSVLVADTKDTASWGGIAGGLFAYADYLPAAFSKGALVEGAWLLGDTAAIGGTLDVFGGAINGDPAKQTVVTVLWAAPKLVGAIRIPGLFGQLGLDPLRVFPLGAMVHDKHEMASLQLAVPNDPRFKGLTLAVQGLAVQPVQRIYTLTNDAWLRVR